MNVIEAASHYCPLLTKGTVVTASMMSIFEWPEGFRETGNVFTEQVRADRSAVFFSRLVAPARLSLSMPTEEYIRARKLHCNINRIGLSRLAGTSWRVLVRKSWL